MTYLVIDYLIHFLINFKFDEFVIDLSGFFDFAILKSEDPRNGSEEPKIFVDLGRIEATEPLSREGIERLECRPGILGEAGCLSILEFLMGA